MSKLLENKYWYKLHIQEHESEPAMRMRAKHGWAGYGAYVLVLGIAHKRDGVILNSDIDMLSICYNIDITLLSDVITVLQQCNEVVVEDDVNSFPRALETIKAINDSIEAKSNAGKKGMASRWENHNSVITEQQQNNNSVITKDNRIRKKNKNIDIELNKDINIEKEKNKEIESEKEKKEKYLDCVELTHSQVDSIKKRVGEDGFAWCVEQLDAHKGATGTTYKNDYKAMVKWVFEAWEKRGKKNQPYQSAAQNTPLVPLTPPTDSERKEILECIEYLKQVKGIQSLDGSLEDNFSACKELLMKLASAYPQSPPERLIRQIIDASQLDPFHAKNTSRFRYITNNWVAIMSSAKAIQDKPMSMYIVS